MEKLASCVAIVALLSNAVVAADTGSGVVSTVRADIDSMCRTSKSSTSTCTRIRSCRCSKKTAAKLAQRMRKLGLVTTQVGGTGIVALLKNGGGSDPPDPHRHGRVARPRTDQVPCASKVTQKDAVTGELSPSCMPAVTMCTWRRGLARRPSSRSWRSVAVPVMFVGQPAEERIRSAKAMLADGLYTRFGKPDAALGIHDHDMTPSGTVGVVPGYIMANADAVDVTFHGIGGHGAYPHDRGSGGDGRAVSWSRYKPWWRARTIPSIRR